MYTKPQIQLFKCEKMCARISIQQCKNNQKIYFEAYEKIKRVKDGSCKRFFLTDMEATRVVTCGDCGKVGHDYKETVDIISKVSRSQINRRYGQITQETMDDVDSEYSICNSDGRVARGSNIGWVNDVFKHL